MDTEVAMKLRTIQDQEHFWVVYDDVLLYEFEPKSLAYLFYRNTEKLKGWALMKHSKTIGVFNIQKKTIPKSFKIKYTPLRTPGRLSTVEAIEAIKLGFANKCVTRYGDLIYTLDRQRNWLFLQHPSYGHLMSIDIDFIGSDYIVILPDAKVNVPLRWYEVRQ